MSGELHELSVKIGGIEAKVTMLMQIVRDNQEATTIEHRKVHEVVDATAEAVRLLSGRVDEMKLLTDDYRERRAEARGAARLLHVLYVGVGGVAGATTTWLMQAIAGRAPHP